MQVKKSIVCGLQKGVRVAIYFFLDLFGAERCSDLEVKRYSSLPCRSSIEKQLQTVKVCVKSRKRNRNNGMTDNLSSLSLTTSKHQQTQFPTSKTLFSSPWRHGQSAVHPKCAGFLLSISFPWYKSNSKGQESGGFASMMLFCCFPPGSYSKDNSSFLPSIPCGQLQCHSCWQSYA